ncbi:MAG: hypothetical protein U0165_08185 [Polyangiaceae bacterium]
MSRLLASILSDAPRIYGIAYQFLTSASEKQLDGIDISLELISVGVHLAIELRTLTNKSRKSDDAGAAERADAERAASTAFTSALALRTQTVRLLKGIAGRSAELRKRVDERTGTAETAEALAQGLEAQAKLMREFLSPQEGRHCRSGEALQDDRGPCGGSTRRHSPFARQRKRLMLDHSQRCDSSK